MKYKFSEKFFVFISDNGSNEDGKFYFKSLFLLSLFYHILLTLYFPLSCITEDTQNGKHI